MWSAARYTLLDDSGLLPRLSDALFEPWLERGPFQQKAFYTCTLPEFLHFWYMRSIAGHA